MPEETPSPAVNLHGRRWGRGVRPYLLVVKLVSVAAFLGGQMALLAELTRPDPVTPDDWQFRAVLLHRAYQWVILPGLLTAITCGIALLIPVWRPLTRMRWFIAKMLLFAVAVPILHVWTRARLTMLDAALADPMNAQVADRLCHELRWAVIAGVAFGASMLILGRIKPRLGQDYGRTFGRSS